MGILCRDEDARPGRHVITEPVIEEKQPMDASELTLIAAGSELEGSLIGTADVRIVGRFKGEVDVSKRVEIAENGYFEGKIKAREVLVKGTVLGSIVCGDLLEIAASGRVDGEVTAPRLVMVDGGFLKGKTHMGGGQAPPPDKVPVVEPPAPGPSEVRKEP